MKKYIYIYISQARLGFLVDGKERGGRGGSQPTSRTTDGSCFRNEVDGATRSRRTDDVFSVLSLSVQHTVFLAAERQEATFSKGWTFTLCRCALKDGNNQSVSGQLLLCSCCDSVHGRKLSLSLSQPEAAAESLLPKRYFKPGPG
jgi:hypothetical protein